MYGCVCACEFRSNERVYCVASRCVARWTAAPASSDLTCVLRCIALRRQVYGCVCEFPYSGFDCSLRSCQTGDDPITSGQFNEAGRAFA